MHDMVKRYENIISTIKEKLEEQKIKKFPKIIAVSKTFKLEKVLPLLSYGHLDYGENKVQEAVEKWTDIKLKNPDIKLHLIGKLQTNKVKFALKIFDYIHSVDNKKLAKKIADEQLKQNKKIKIFLQINMGHEDQKSGINEDELDTLYNYCTELNLDVIGLMCIPPVNEKPNKFFKKINLINKRLNLTELSMGMSSDYLSAVENNSTYLRIGSSIFGQRN
jgi:pyridoxal phosphate enzyme (YggS family)